MTAGNAATVDSFFDAMQSHGVREAIEQYAADDFVWWSAGAGEVQDKIAEFMDEFGAQVSGAFQLNVGTKTAEGDRVAVEATIHAELTDDRIYHNDFHMLFTFRDGLITRIAEYHDTRHAFDVIGPTLRKVGFVDEQERHSR